MSFTPLVPFTGLAGWSFLRRTGAEQQIAFANSGEIGRDIEYFRDNVAAVKTAEDLVNDRRILKVALGAFGLSDDMENRYFVRKVLEDGTLSSDALANRLSDARYAEFSRAFGFGDGATPLTLVPGFADNIIAAYKTQSFEVAIGKQNNELRLAMNAERELPEIANSTKSEDGKWYQIMSSQPLREVFRTAFGFPSAFVSIDLDQQLEALKDAANRYLGISDPSEFSRTESREDLIRLFLLRSELSATGTGYSGRSVALTLLQNASAGRVSLNV